MEGQETRNQKSLVGFVNVREVLLAQYGRAMVRYRAQIQAEGILVFFKSRLISILASWVWRSHTTVF
jgi:hypothetical protein